MKTCWLWKSTHNSCFSFHRESTQTQCVSLRRRLAPCCPFPPPPPTGPQRCCENKTVAAAASHSSGGRLDSRWSQQCVHNMLLTGQSPAWLVLTSHHHHLHSNGCRSTVSPCYDVTRAFIEALPPPLPTVHAEVNDRHSTQMWPTGVGHSVFPWPHYADCWKGDHFWQRRWLPQILLFLPICNAKVTQFFSTRFFLRDWSFCGSDHPPVSRSKASQSQHDQDY